MFRKLFNKLEELIVWGQSKLTNKQFIFLSSVLVGISAALAVIVLKTFAHWVYAFAIRINKILNLNFIFFLLIRCFQAPDSNFVTPVESSQAHFSTIIR